MEGEISFCDLRKKEVVNAADGSRLGHIVDMIISVDTKMALGIVAPGRKTGFFSKERNIFIPLASIIKIGEDVILINLAPCADNPPAGDNTKHSSGCSDCGLYSDN